ncbi:hypothetical protein BpHYR1_034551 [Brachionus plicatilis]|uniref:Uncharacterized protein n=1 Tax=Brachionus plicatilis TaxID=10195 RepID=A0A3M7R1M5_BRAPC|nr:hypothetical protein BpHYR1_034551 [Brachionus plicatilis]
MFKFVRGYNKSGLKTIFEKNSKHIFSAGIKPEFSFFNPGVVSASLRIITKKCKYNHLGTKKLFFFMTHYKFYNI